MTDRTITYRIRGDIRDLQAKMLAASKSVTGAADSMTAADAKSAKFRKGLSSVGDVAGKIGLGAAAGLGAAIAVSARFDKAMSGVEAATHASASSMETLRAAALQAGQDTAFSATEAADGIEQLAKAGVSTGDILKGGLNGALDLAAAGTMEVGDAAEVAATAMTQFKLAGDQVPHVADLLAAAAGKAQGEVSDFGYALKQGGLVAAQTGLSIEETTGALGAFASAGLLGSDAGTSMKTMFQSLTPSSDKAASAIESLGISAYDQQGQFIGLEKWAGRLREGLKDMSAEQRNATLKTVFGSDAVRAASIIYEQGADGVGKWIKKVDDAGFAAETAAIKTDNLAGDWERLTGSIETAMIGMGDSSQGPLRSLVQRLDDGVNKFNEMPDAAKGTTAALLGITAVTGGALWFGSKVINAVADTRQAISDLGLSSSKTAGFLKGVGKAAGVAAAGVAALQILDDLVNSTDKSAPGVERLTSSLLDLGGASAGKVTGDLEGLGASIERLVNPAWDDQSDDWLRDKLPILGDNKGLKEAKVDIDALDSAFAGLVASVGAGGARSKFEALAQSLHLTTGETAKLRSLMPQYSEALIGAENSARTAARGADDHAGAVTKEKQALRGAYAALTDYTDAQNKAAESAVGNKRNAIALKETLIDARKEMAKGTRTLNDNTKAGRDNWGALLDVADQWNTTERRVQNARGAYQRMRREFVDLAIGMGASRKEAQKYADKFLDIPPNVAKARGAVEGFVRGTNSALDRINDEQVNIVLSGQAKKAADGMGYASGGAVFGAGTATSDSIDAKLSNGEHVLTAKEVKAFGGHQIVELWRKAALKHALPDPRDLPRFATGGAVGLKVRQSGLASSVASISAMFDAIGDRISDRLSKKATRLLTQVGGALGTGGSLSVAQIARGQQFARSQVGKPYVWGGAGPGGYDCSGFQSAVLNAARGRYPYSRLGSTGSMPWAGSRPGPGRYTMGWFVGSPGHTSGNIGGLNVESAGGVGVRVGASARSPRNPMFNRMMHFAGGGPVDPAVARRARAGQQYQTQPQRMAVSFNDVNLHGSVRTPAGIVDVRGIARAEARKVVRDYRQHDQTMKGMHS